MFEVDAYQLALDTTWDWAERRGVRVEFWRNVDVWRVQVTVADSQGDISGDTTLRLFRPARMCRGATQAKMRDDYIKGVCAALDGAVIEARARRARRGSA
jgi:hypothetical protein